MRRANLTSVLALVAMLSIPAFSLGDAETPQPVGEPHPVAEPLVAPAPAPMPLVAPTPATEAPVAPGLESPEDAMSMAAQLWVHISSGRWGAAVGAVMMLLIFAIRRFGMHVPKIGPWLATQMGGYVLAVLTSAGAIIGAALAAGELSWGVIGSAIAAAFTAIGVYQAVRDATHKTSQPST